LAVDNDLAPFLTVVETVLGRLSNRDAMQFSERNVKAVFAALLTPSNVYLVRSEPELERRYADLLCTALPAVRVNHNFVFELKYLKKSDADRIEETTRAAKTQLEGYLQTPDLRQIPDLRAYAIVFVGDEAKSVVRVG